jgi:hypothetical protein
MDPGLWKAVDDVVGRAPGPREIALHRLEALAARRLRTAGEPVPDELAGAERTGALLSLAAPAVLARVRAGCDGPLLVVKGPETAAFYPDPALRLYRDLDLVVPDAARTQRQLVAAGFIETGSPAVFAGGPHERPLHPGDVPILVEVHHAPNWPRGLEPPTARELLAAAVPSRLALDDVLALPPAHHALLLAAHGWAHGPLARLRDLIDVAAVVSAADEDELQALARRWRLERLWGTVRGLADAVFYGRRPPALARTWAGNLLAARERRVFESHLGLWVGGFSALPPHRALGELLWQLADDVRPAPGERWVTKLRRTRRALGNLAVSKSHHDHEIDPATEGGPRQPPRRPPRSAEERRDRDDRDRQQEQHAGEDG